jgi:hypothetical protein
MQFRNNYLKTFLVFWAAIFLIGIIYIRFRLLGLPLERDEGEYAYMAQQLLQGILPYTESQSMKFPGIYIAYAGILAVFGHSPVAIHLSLLIVNLATAFLLYLLARNLWSHSAGIVSTVSFSVLTLSPSLQGVWANSEHFVLLPAIGGILLLRMAKDRPVQLFLSGLLLGSALLIKQHAIFFCLFGVISLVGSKRLKKTFLHLSIFFAGVLTPVFLSAILYGITGNFSDLWFSTIQYASEYVSLVAPGQGFENFKYVFAKILEPNFSILWLSLFGLASVFWRKEGKPEYLYLFGFFLCSFLAVTPGFYFRPHYFLLWIPALSLLVGLSFESIIRIFSSPKFKTIIPAGILVLVFALPIWIQKEFFFVFSLKEATRWTYGMNPFWESLETAKYIRDHSHKGDQVAILGSEPQILFYAQRKSATRYIYMYPLMEKHPYAHQMQTNMIEEIEKARPKFVVVVNIAGSWVSPRPDLSPLLKDWSQDYLNKEYEITGVVDNLSHEESVSMWSEEVKGYHTQSMYNFLVYKRRV